MGVTERKEAAALQSGCEQATAMNDDDNEEKRTTGGPSLICEVIFFSSYPKAKSLLIPFPTVSVGTYIHTIIIIIITTPVLCPLWMTNSAVLVFLRSGFFH